MPVRRTARPLAALALGAALLVPALAGCSGSSASPASPAPSSPAVAGPSAPAAPAIANGSHLTPQDFQSAMTAPNTVVLDVRTPSEFASGHLPNAMNIDVEAGDFGQQIANLDKSKTYAVYCHSGRRSGIALDQMMGAGFGSVYDLAGGIAAWQSAGGQVVTG